MTSYEFAEYIALEEISPFLEERADLRIGILCALIANVNRDAKKRPDPFVPADFMPFVPEEVRKRGKQKSLGNRLFAALAPVKKNAKERKSK